MLDWEKIDTVLLDMDGTLLDLNFDNHFWQEFVPQRYAEQRNMTLTHAKEQLAPQFKAMEGKLEWYCLDYWSETLELDIVGLKKEISGLISILPHVTEFLSLMRKSSKRLILVTNAHRDSLDLKMDKTCLQHFFDELVSSHDFGYPKEHPDFWLLFQKRFRLNLQKAVFVDDNLAVLKCAKNFGIKHVVSISRPDSKKTKREIDDYPAIEDFRALMTGL